MEELNNCLDVVKNIINDYAEEHDIRVCSECGHLMDEGYVTADFEYYCSDNCLHKEYSEQEWKQLTEDFEDDYYWTEWR